MLITEDTRVNKALDLGPQVLEYIVALAPHEFERLRNPMMRRLMSPRITLGRIARMVGVPAATIITDIAALADQRAAPPATTSLLPFSSAVRPPWVDAAVDDPVIPVVDLPQVDDALDADPMPPVISAIHALSPGGVCRIRHWWEPQPLYDVWSRMGGLAWHAEQHTPDEWWIWVRREPDDG